MVLEATFIVIDNSDWMRNGDFAPSRLDAQQDAVNLLAGAKTQSNPENTVGVLTMAGKGVEVRVAMTSDVGKVLSQSHGAQVSGEINLSAGLQVAGLALKHRQNKNQRQRIVVFVGSPIKEDEKDLVKLGKKLKKNSVAVDIVNFGEEAENTPKLEALLNAVNSDENSHLVTVPPGPHVLSDILLSSPIVQGEDGGGAAAAMATGGGGGGEGGFAEFGVDPSLDPEFAWALRVSMEEERQRQENEAKAKADAEGGASAGGEAAAAGGGEGSATESAAAASGADGASAKDAPMAEAAGAEMDEAALLEAAIAMSQADAAVPSSSLVTPVAAGPAATPDAPPAPPAASITQLSPVPPGAAPADVEMGDADEDMDEEMQLALAMSMSQEGGGAAGAAAVSAAPAAAANPDLAMFQDASFVQSVLGSLPGVDPTDPRIQSVISALPSSAEKKDGEDTPKEGDGK